MPPPSSKEDVGIWQFAPPPCTKYPLDTIFTDQTKGVLYVGVVKYNKKFTIVYSNNTIEICLLIISKFAEVDKPTNPNPKWSLTK